MIDSALARAGERNENRGRSELFFLALAAAFAGARIYCCGGLHGFFMFDAGFMPACLCSGAFLHH
ncbi:MAG: hypothetical protein BHV77_04515 [Bacteroides sp. 43_108]|nr:MAG: hypothetical protein BHV77_04515 [Bacteroides sp. 43_108]